MRNWILILILGVVSSTQFFAQDAMNETKEIMTKVNDFLQLAEGFAKNGKYKSSRKALISAIKMDWVVVEENILQNENFEKLKKKKRHWKKVNKAFGKAKKSINVSLRDELLAIKESDQKYRSQINELLKKGEFDSPEIPKLEAAQNVLDAENLKRVEAIISQHGYPSKKLVGRKAGKAIFYVIQHSDSKMQEKYLPLFEEAAAKGDLKKRSLALMIDRNLIDKGRPQVYGTQLNKDKESQKVIVSQVIDVKNINKRRAAIGLPTIEEYLERYDGAFSPKAQKLSNKDFKKFLGGWQLVNIRNAETFEIVFNPKKTFWINFGKKGRMKFLKDVNQCEVPFQAEANGKIRFSKLANCTRKCCDDPKVSSIVNYHNVNSFEMYDNVLYLKGNDNRIWEFKKRGLEREAIRGN